MSKARSLALKWTDRFLNTVARDGAVVERLVNRFLFALRKNSSERFYTYHTRPQRAAAVGLDPVAPIPTDGMIGIVIQGPLLREADFTMETAALYLRTFPTAHVVISTWQNEDLGQHEIHQNARLHVVKSVPPKTSGLGTTNYQLVSTRAGIERLEALGCQYVLKTRSDQRVYAANLDHYLIAQLHQYPSRSEHQKHRIVELSMNICRYRPYSMCDMFQFGHISDMKDMWFAELDERHMSTKQFSSRKLTSRDVSEANIGEIYLHRKYLEKIKADSAVSMRNYYQALLDHFIVIDKEQVDLYWHKYHCGEYSLAENPTYSTDPTARQKARFYHRDWIAGLDAGIDIFPLDDALMDRFEN
ncbi:WavE lipopolysaccharide synthesis family protein [Mitsuaria sp. CC2]|uniref:WavE lipopolysaccharide synthesis family protein n=1 Tax=Mitsuaria sp. CC2 TaxID=3029186 RepID=UPI003B8AFBD3